MLHHEAVEVEVIECEGLLCWVGGIHGCGDFGLWDWELLGCRLPDGVTDDLRAVGVPVAGEAV